MANKNLFQQIQLKPLPRNVFDLSHDVKFTGKMGELIPILAMDALPGDNFNLAAESLIRFAPMVAPVMHRFNATIHYFFVPNRLIWDNWEKYIVDPNTAIVHPFLRIAGYTSDEAKKLLDYMGVPPSSTTAAGTAEDINPLPLAAYQAIYHEYYRDQNLIPEFGYKCTDGDQSLNPDGMQLLKLRKRAWEHDYFTSALPWAQKGASVSIPLGDVQLKTTTGQAGVFRDYDDHLPNAGTNQPISANVGVPQIGATAQVYDPMGTLEVDSTTITDLRRAFKLQEFLEKAARAGTRYIEHIKAFFNVNPEDYRLQRPEYITGVKTPIIVSEVLNTTGETLPQGNMSGHGVGVLDGGGKGFFCKEHGWIIGIMSVMPVPAYQQGIERQFLKIKSPLDYYFEQFAHIGEQEVYRKELYAYSTDGDVVFGYVPRYSEYKYKPSRVAGDFRTNLDYWHAGRIFADVPQLNQEFIECTTDDRIFAVTDPTEDKLYIQVYHKVKATRPMPYYGSPRM